MDIQIEKKGLETILNTILSCRCPVDENVEAAVFETYHKVKHQELIDYNEFLQVAGSDTKRTPLHLLADFCTYSKDDPSSFIITHNDAIRYSCTGYHFNHFKTNIDPLSVRDTLAYLIGHMIVPARLKKDGPSISATYTHQSHTIQFYNIVIPPNLEIGTNTAYGIHLATAVTTLTESQENMVYAHLNNILGYHDLVKHVSEVDYTKFQSFGNYRAQVQERVDRNFD